MATDKKKKEDSGKKKPAEHKYGVYHAPDYKDGKKPPKKKIMVD